MFCPRCGSEYLPEVTKCVDCEIPLVAALVPKPEQDHDLRDLVKVYEAGTPADVAIAESLLESGGIEFMTRGEGIQDLLGWGRFPGRVNLVTGPVLFLVRPDDAERAEALLRELPQGKAV